MELQSEMLPAFREQALGLAYAAEEQRPSESSAKQSQGGWGWLGLYLGSLVRHSETCSACSDDEMRRILVISPSHNLPLNPQNIIRHDLSVIDLPFSLALVSQYLTED